MDAYVKSLQTWLMNTSVSYAMNNYHYAWRTSESIHFIGLSLCWLLHERHDGLDLSGGRPRPVHIQPRLSNEDAVHGDCRTQRGRVLSDNVPARGRRRARS